MLNRTGGRLDSDLIDIDKQTVRDEEGGMRFTKDMQWLMKLVEILDIPKDDIVPFPMSDKVKQGSRSYVRGHAFLARDAKPIVWDLLYHLNQSERGKTPGEIVAEVYESVCHENGIEPPASPDPDFWTLFRNKYVWKNIALKKWQLNGLLHDMGYSAECVRMLSSNLGFSGPFLGLASAGEALQILMDFPADPMYFTFKRGYEQLPCVMRERVLAKGAAIHLSTMATRIVRNKDGEFRVGATVAPDQQNALQFMDGGKEVAFRAKKVILALPKSAMEHLFLSSPALSLHHNSGSLYKALGSVQSMRLLKINLYFEHEWWQDPTYVKQEFEFGPNFTDLPINAVYPFYSLCGDEDHKRPAALTIYCDFNNTNFWQGLQNAGEHELFNSALQAKYSEAKPQLLFAASLLVVEEALKQLTLLFEPIKEIPRPLLTSYRLWAGFEDGGFGYGYHQWRMNADDEHVREVLKSPMENIYVCNEAFSSEQGWVNGSLESSELVLKEFGIPSILE